MPPLAASSSTLWVGNLSERLGEEDVRHFFERYGQVTRVKLGVPPSGIDQFGFITFANAQAAKQALEELDGLTWTGVSGSRPFKVDLEGPRSAGAGGPLGQEPSVPKARSTSKRSPNKGIRAPCVLWMGYLEPDVTEDDVWQELSEYAAIRCVELHITHTGTGQFALLGLDSEEEGEGLVEQLNGSRRLWVSGGRALKVQHANSKGGSHAGGGKGTDSSGGASATSQHPLPQPEQLEPHQRVNWDHGGGVSLVRGHLIMDSPPALLVWAGNICPQADQAAVKELLSRYGQVTHVTLGRPKGYASQFAIVGFRSTDQAQQAVQALDGSQDAPIVHQGQALILRYARPRGMQEFALDELVPAEQQREWDNIAVTHSDLEDATRTLWVGNLIATPSQRTLDRVFARFGRIESTRVVEGKPFAFVSYCDKLSAAWALKALKRKTVAALCGNRTLTVEYSGGKGQGGATKAPSSSTTTLSSKVATANGKPGAPPGLVSPTRSASQLSSEAGSEVAVAAGHAAAGRQPWASSDGSNAGSNDAEHAAPPLLPPGGVPPQHHQAFEWAGEQPSDAFLPTPAPQQHHHRSQPEATLAAAVAAPPVHPELLAHQAVQQPNTASISQGPAQQTGASSNMSASAPAVSTVADPDSLLGSQRSASQHPPPGFAASSFEAPTAPQAWHSTGPAGAGGPPFTSTSVHPPPAEVRPQPQPTFAQHLQQPATTAAATRSHHGLPPEFWLPGEGPPEAPAPPQPPHPAQPLASTQPLAPDQPPGPTQQPAPPQPPAPTQPPAFPQSLAPTQPPGTTQSPASAQQEAPTQQPATTQAPDSAHNSAAIEQPLAHARVSRALTTSPAATRRHAPSAAGAVPVNCCACCGATEASHGVVLRSCTGCQATQYCNSNCQLRDWGEGGHHADCGQLAAAMAAFQAHPACAQLVQTGLDRPFGREAGLLRRVLAHLELAADLAAPPALQ